MQLRWLRMIKRDLFVFFFFWCNQRSRGVIKVYELPAFCELLIQRLRMIHRNWMDLLKWCNLYCMHLLWMDLIWSYFVWQWIIVNSYLLYYCELNFYCVLWTMGYNSWIAVKMSSFANGWAASVIKRCWIFLLLFFFWSWRSFIRSDKFLSGCVCQSLNYLVFCWFFEYYIM